MATRVFTHKGNKDTAELSLTRKFTPQKSFTPAPFFPFSTVELPFLILENCENCLNRKVKKKRTCCTPNHALQVIKGEFNEWRETGAVGSMSVEDR